MVSWARTNNVKLHFVEPGKPQQNAFIESFNSHFQAECLEQNLFETIAEAGRLISNRRAIMKISDRILL